MRFSTFVCIWGLQIKKSKTNKQINSMSRIVKLGDVSRTVGEVRNSSRRQGVSRWPFVKVQNRLLCKKKKKRKASKKNGLLKSGHSAPLELWSAGRIWLEASSCESHAPRPRCLPRSLAQRQVRCWLLLFAEKALRGRARTALSTFGQTLAHVSLSGSRSGFWRHFAVRPAPFPHCLPGQLYVPGASPNLACSHPLPSS